MKRMIKAATQFPFKGTARPADKRSGLIKFGADYKVMLPSGWYLKLPTGVVRLDSITGQIDCYLNISLFARPTGPDHYGMFRNEFIGYTAEEAERLYASLFEMSADELEATYPAW